MKDLDKLRSEISFACNNIYLVFPQTVWRPTYYTVSDPSAAAQFAPIIDSLELRKVFSDSVRPYFSATEDVTWLRQIQYARDDDLSDFAFSFDLRNGVYHGATTLYIQFQLAFFMGIKEIYLVGVDFDYKRPLKPGKRSGLGMIVEQTTEMNHFHPDCRRMGENWELGDTEFQKKTLAFAASIFEAYGGKIINASRSTALGVFPRVELDALLNEFQ